MLHLLNYNIYKENMIEMEKQKNVQLKPNWDVLSDQISLSFRVGHWQVQTTDKTYVNTQNYVKTNRIKVQSEYRIQLQNNKTI